MLYMAVTPDKYELPMMVSNNTREIANSYGVTYENMLSQISKNLNGKKQGVKFVRVEEEDMPE